MKQPLLILLRQLPHVKARRAAVAAAAASAG